MQQKITSKTFNDCEVCAYHESGHILFAYLCGYTCIEAQLISPPMLTAIRAMPLSTMVKMPLQQAKS
jgi:hypothetical protein